jgi:hypothetical protein
LTVAIIGILVLAWIGFLAPTILKARNNQGRADSIGDFHHRLRALGRTGGDDRKPQLMRSQQPLFGPVSVSSGAMTPTQKRRRDVLLVLGGVVVVTLLAAVVTRNPMLIVMQLIADAALAGYVYLLLQYKQRAGTQRTARPLPGTPTAPAYMPYPLPTYRMDEIDLREVEPVGPRLVPLRQPAMG